MSTNVYIPLIIKQLKKINPYKIMLFGSHAYGQPNVDSDIDLLVVTSSDYFPRNFQEKSDIHLEVSKVIRELRKQVSIDLIVHTKAMHKKFIEQDSMFSKEISQNGIVVYEADN